MTTGTATLLQILEPTKQQIVDYTNAIAEVNAYAYAITQQTMPDLHQPPAHYSEFVVAFARAKSHCLDWTTKLFPALVSLPAAIARTGADFDIEVDAMASHLAKLAKDPTDADAKKKLARTLSIAQDHVRDHVVEVEQLLDLLNQFSTDIAKDATVLSDIAAAALKTVGDDHARITTLTDLVEKLKRHLDELKHWIDVAEAVSIASTFFSLLGLFLIPFSGGASTGLLIVAGVLGTVAGTSEAVLREKLSQDTKEIADHQKEIGDLNQDVVLLQALDKSFTWLLEANRKATLAMTMIVAMWRAVDDALTQTANELADMDRDVTAAQYLKAQTDLTAAKASWKGALDVATALAGVTYHWQDATGTWHDYATSAPGLDAATITMLKPAA